MSLFKHVPRFNTGEAVEIVKSVYGMDAVVGSLPSERDQNFLVIDESRERYVLKIANSLESRELLEAQNAVLNHLESSDVYFPRVVSTRSGEQIGSIISNVGDTFLIRLLTYLPGVPIAKIKRSSPFLVEFGKTLARLTRALADFDHQALHREFHWDLVNGLRVVKEYNHLIHPLTLRNTIYSFTERFQSETATILPKLPLSVIHGDANDYNVIVNDGLIGFIDLGDLVHSYSVGELAIALAYVVLDEEAPLDVAADVVEGYLAERELSADELGSLWPLMLMRLCMSVSLAAHQQQQMPENTYLDISQRSIRESLPALMAIQPNEF